METPWCLQNCGGALGPVSDTYSYQEAATGYRSTSHSPMVNLKPGQSISIGGHHPRRTALNMTCLWLSRNQRWRLGA